MPRLLGFSPTKSMLVLYQDTKKEHVIDVVDTTPVIKPNVIENEAKDIQSIEIPTYVKTVKLPELPSEVNDYSSIKRSVNLNPLSDE